jgi:hypothetical protein
MRKKVNLNLVGLDGNAFMLLGAFRRQAKKEGWTKEEIDAVCQQAMSGDYNYLLGVLLEHTETVEEEEEA